MLNKVNYESKSIQSLHQFLFLKKKKNFSYSQVFKINTQVFDRYLLDADWSVCAGSWMWVSSSAFEKVLQCPRCMCPVRYGRRMDPTGKYIRSILKIHFFKCTSSLSLWISNCKCTNLVSYSWWGKDQLFSVFSEIILF